MVGPVLMLGRPANLPTDDNRPPRYRRTNHGTTAHNGTAANNHSAISAGYARCAVNTAHA
jgi:hypothetical protein